MKRLPSLLVTLGLSLSGARAFVLNTSSSGAWEHWDLITANLNVPATSVNRTTHAVIYHLASDAYSTTNTAAELNALRATFAQWQAISNTILKFEEGSLVAPQTDINTSDGTNVIFWARSSLVNGGHDDITGVLGRTYVRFNTADGVLMEADIVLNGATRTWFTDFADDANTGIFVEAVAAHEIGHFIGLAHSPVGGATMLARGGSGLGNLQAGLSSDEIAAARLLYPLVRTNYGSIKGTITKDGSPVLGAQVFIEDAATNLIAGTASRSNGVYQLDSLQPGTYQLRVTAADPNVAARLVSGSDLGTDYSAADTAFVPTPSYPAPVLANATNTLDVTVTNRTPAFRITYLRRPTSNAGAYAWSTPAVTVGLTVGQSGYFIGVGAASFPTNDASFAITGDGLTLGAVSYSLISGINFMSVPINVASNATPGLRSLRVTQYGTNVAYANGFLEILPAVPDVNFDGLDDTFQRTYFPLFTAAVAGPAADPDGDGLNNWAEYISGTNPTNAASRLQLQGVARTNSAATLAWLSAPGKRYQISYRTNVASGNWSNLSSVITANGDTTTFTDPSATNALRLYRLQAVP